RRSPLTFLKSASGATAATIPKTISLTALSDIPARFLSIFRSPKTRCYDRRLNAVYPPCKSGREPPNDDRRVDSQHAKRIVQNRLHTVYPLRSIHHQVSHATA